MPRSEWQKLTSTTLYSFMMQTGTLNFPLLNTKEIIKKIQVFWVMTLHELLHHWRIRHFIPLKHRDPVTQWQTSYPKRPASSDIPLWEPCSLQIIRTTHNSKSCNRHTAGSIIIPLLIKVHMVWENIPIISTAEHEMVIIVETHATNSSMYVIMHGIEPIIRKVRMIVWINTIHSDLSILHAENQILLIMAAWNKWVSH